MVYMCREKETGMAEECRRSDVKRALRACTECGILLGASEFFQKLCDTITLRFFQDEPCGVVVPTEQAADSAMDRPPSSAGQTQDGVVYQQEE